MYGIMVFLVNTNSMAKTHSPSGLWKRRPRLGFRQRRVYRVDKSVHVDILPEVVVRHRDWFTGLRFDLTDIYRISEFIGIAVSDEDSHRDRHVALVAVIIDCALEGHRQ